jgi:NlpC/P60 family putative phage cell wall peptidase
MHPAPDDIVEAARGWLGTPYRHQASLKGVGCDCLGLVRGVWREVMGPEPELPPAYARDWAEAGGAETLLAAAARHLETIAAKDARSGDVLAFRWRAHLPAAHLAIVAGEARMIHAQPRASVCEVAIGAWWQRHLAAAFRFRRPASRQDL